MQPRTHPRTHTKANAEAISEARVAKGTLHISGAPSSAKGVNVRVEALEALGRALWLLRPAVGCQLLRTLGRDDRTRRRAGTRPRAAVRWDVEDVGVFNAKNLKR